MSGRYILDGQTPVPIDDLMTWALWFETADRCVAQSDVGGMRVSTIFLGVDHSFGSGPPLLFETMIFGLPGASIRDIGDGKVEVRTGAVEYQERCSTWGQAEVMHKRAVEHARILFGGHRATSLASLWEGSAASRIGARMGHMLTALCKRVRAHLPFP